MTRIFIVTTEGPEPVIDVSGKDFMTAAAAVLVEFSNLYSGEPDPDIMQGLCELACGASKFERNDFSTTESNFTMFQETS